MHLARTLTKRLFICLVALPPRPPGRGLSEERLGASKFRAPEVTAAEDGAPPQVDFAPNPEELELLHTFLTVKTGASGVISLLTMRWMDAACARVEETNRPFPNASAMNTPKRP